MIKGPDLTFNGGDYDAYVAKLRNLSLSANVYSIPESTGGTVHFQLEASVLNANRKYLLLGSVTGFDPGIPLPGGKAVLPINWDLFTDIILNLMNKPVFTNFMGVLDATGSATAQMNLGPIPGTAGITLYFAYALNLPWDFASNPVEIEIVP